MPTLKTEISWTWPFDEDGRHLMVMPFQFPGTKQIAVRVATARMTVKRFLEQGTSRHSGAGSTLWVLIYYCQTNNIPYKLTAVPQKGYCIERCVYED